MGQQSLHHHDVTQVPKDACLNYVPPPVQVHQWGEPGGAGDRYDPSSFHSSQGGEGGQSWQPGGSAHVLLLALRVPAHPLPPTQGDKAGLTGATRLDLSPTPMEDSRVEILTRPAINVYARTF